ncbi:MAG: DedA family protein [bacterium]|nr:DedA family protein [bacterium]
MEAVDNSILRLLYEHRYIFAFLGAFFEGTYIMLLSGVLFKFGYFKFWGLIAVLFSGYFLNGIAWYLIGRAGGYKVLEKWGKRWHMTRKLIEKLEYYFKHHSIKTIFIARITCGFSMPVLMIAGSLKTRWKKLLSVTFVATIFWIAMLMGLGYVFGLGYSAMGRVMETIATGLTILIFALITLAVIFILYFSTKFMRKKFISGLEKEENSFLEKTGEMFNHLFKDKKD